MKKLFLLLLVVALVLPVGAAGNFVNDGEGLLTASEVSQLENLYSEYAADSGFTPILVTTDSFGGQYAQDYAADFYDSHGYPYDGILFLVSLTEGEWYILTNGACYDRISNRDVENMGEELVAYLRDGAFYEAFALFPVLTDLYFSEASAGSYGGADGPTAVYETGTKNYGKTIAISMGVGLLIGLVAVGIMASQMKTVRQQNAASDYVRAGSMQLTNQRDIFLYSHVSRTAKPKSNSSGGGHGGGSRGGAGGRI